MWRNLVKFTDALQPPNQKRAHKRFDKQDTKTPFVHSTYDVHNQGIEVDLPSIFLQVEKLNDGKDPFCRQ